MNLPIRLRLTLWYTALLAGALLLFSGTVYAVMASTLVTNLDSTLQQRLAQAHLKVNDAGGRLTLPGGEEQTDISAIPLVLLSPSGRILVGGLPPDAGLWVRQHASSLPATLRLVTAGNERLAIKPVLFHHRRTGYALVWQSTRPIEEARHSLLLALLGAGLGLLVIAGFGGLALARRALQPVSALTQTASAISVTDLHRRVEVNRPQDELSELAVTFNAMIDRLDAAVQREKSFTADASHELRAPLAVIRAESTLALDRPRRDEEYRQALARIDEQAAAMEDLIAALLMLARVESPSAFAPEAVVVERLVAAAIVQARQSIDRPDVRIQCEAPADLIVEGSVPLLTRAIRNLIENALKVSKPGDAVCLRAARDGDAIVLTVCDQGPGIAADHQRHIFEPFYQVTSSRPRGTSHGLGLAICCRIITAHGGQVTVESTPGQGACFRVTLPVAGR